MPIYAEYLDNFFLITYLISSILGHIISKFAIFDSVTFCTKRTIVTFYVKNVLKFKYPPHCLKVNSVFLTYHRCQLRVLFLFNLASFLPSIL